MKEKNVLVLGATGLVGQTLIKILEERKFPVKDIYLYASERSEGMKVIFKDEEIDVLCDYNGLKNKVDIVFGCLDAELSKKIIPEFKKDGVVIDNSTAFRFDPDVPLVIPEINPEKIKEHKGIIANPNCSTIQLLLPLYPLHKFARIKRIFVSTYQSVSGYGKEALEELKLEIECLAMDEEIVKEEGGVFSFPIGANIIPQIGGFDESGYTSEELKMLNETRKILDDPSILVSATCVRIPVFFGHSEAVSVEFEKPISPEEAKNILKDSSGIKVIEDNYPMPIYAAGKDMVFVGRIRKDLALENGLCMWIVADNVRKGAALNAVQIAELI